MNDRTQTRDANMSTSNPVLSIRALRLPAPSRGEDLQLRVSAPATGENLPVVLFSHGHGASMDAYAPLADHWAAHGFVVIQPTHLDARRLALSPEDPRRPFIWRIRVEDMTRILDHLPSLTRARPWLDGRVSHERVAAAGHSFGGQTVSMLLGGRMQGHGAGEDMRDPRVKAGVLLASGGRGGADLSDFARQYTPWLDMAFEQLVTPTLVVAGDADQSPLTVRGPDWFEDPFRLSPGGRALLTLHGGEHMLGGISGHEVSETTDERPARVALIQWATTAFLRGALVPAAGDWETLVATLAGEANAEGHLTSRQAEG
ncbi:alpha/beta hydrolase family protein [Corallococcus silvisoli]|uniref:alpha/beta hydrolase family protein n=1 Tax=Corallococcus silvisoli TaxID=2697031 RepID=UPI0013771430|nr:chlorophyllase [Corallococcus silvisoli]NBD12357.1 chlorophyllase [Corallococcus silvisoli]